MVPNNLELELAELVSRYVPAGTVVLRLPRHLAARLADAVSVQDPGIQTADDVEMVEPMAWNELDVRYRLDDLLGPGHAEIEREGAPNIIVALPSPLQA